MRPGRGRTAAIAAAAAIANSSTRKATTPPTTSSTANKNKCIVRLEKVPKKDDKKEEEIDDKTPIVASIKKRSMSGTPTPTSPNKKGRKPGSTKKENKDSTEDLSEYNLVTARAKRTPKPNPKYSSSDVFTKYPKSEKVKSEDESNPDFEDSAEEYEIDSGDVKDNESDEEFEGHFAKKGKIGTTTLIKGRDRESQSIRIESGIKRKLNSEGKVVYNKRLNLEIFDGSDSDMSVPSPSSQKSRNTSKSSVALDKHRQSLLRPIMKSVHESEMQKSKPIQILERRKENSSALKSNIKRPLRRNEDDDFEITPSKTASTTDDFETMPTFTIVNINDIMKKKADELLEIESKSKETEQHPLLNKIKKSNTTPQIRNLNKQPILLNNNISKSLLKSSPETGKSLNPPPRILNSVIGKRTRPISPIVNPKEVGKPIVSVAPQQRQAKESNLKNVVPTGNTRRIPITKKLPNERVVVHRQGTRIIKKITSFESWYAIKIPQTKVEPVYQKNSFDLSLVDLGNRVKEVSLLENWNYKVTLQKLTPNLYNRPNHERYTGDVNDPTVKEEDKIKFQPINITFRRYNVNKTNSEAQRLPFDRALIFKNRTYFINIEGRNVRLIGAPTSINSIEDISKLVEIVNELDLSSPYVEQTNLTM